MHSMLHSLLLSLLGSSFQFIMMMYGKGGSIDIFEVEGLLYIQEAQLDKFCQELVTHNATANIVEPQTNTNVGKGSQSSSFQQYFCGRGRSSRGRGRGRQALTTWNWSTCQLCNKYGHSVMKCLHIFEELLDQPHLKLMLKHQL